MKIYIFSLLFIICGCQTEIDLPEQTIVNIAINNESQLVEGKEYWTGLNDSSGIANISVTEKELLIKISVNDDIIEIDNEKAHENDSIEIYIDTRKKEDRTSQYAKGVFQVIIVPAIRGNKIRTEWYYKGKKMSLANIPIKNVTTSSNVLKGKWYQIVASFPLSEFLKNNDTTIETLRIAIGFNDVDNKEPRTQFMSNSFKKNCIDPTKFNLISIPKIKKEEYE